MRRRATGWTHKLRTSPGIESLIKIHFDWINSGELNALADIRENIGLIACNRGAFHLPLDMFSRIMADRNVLFRIGHPVGEAPLPLTPHPQIAEGISKDYDALLDSRKRAGQGTDSIGPIDPLRQAFVRLATCICFDFILTHEAAHISRGHVGLLKNSAGIPFIVETAPRPAHLDMMTWQAIEFDADAQAGGHSLANLFQSAKAKEPDSWPAEYEAICPNAEAIVFAWNFAIAGLFHLWGVKVDFNSLESGDHPPTGMRYGMLANATEQVVRIFHPEILPRIGEIAFFAYSMMRYSLLRLGVDRRAVIHPDDLSFVLMDRRTTNHAKKISDRLHAINPELAKFSYDKQMPDRSTNPHA
ncbi:MAG: hypothetical protein JWL69_4437 [Phycisphaerales bacterium]|nr:hypothetical protein [Phycisphaerales bacterium]MDB5358557.1 hypothetical protein [Phycisphaerales bacterium]